MAIKDLGPVTAYAYAVQGGYTGTEQEFTEALGQAGITLAELEELRAVATTLAEGQQATASYANGVLTLGIPRGATGSTGAKGDKGDTGETGNGIESIELTSTVGKVKTYTITFTDGTTTTFDVTDGEVTEESLAEVLEDYAKNNGYYDEFTAGSAEQLLSTQFVEDSVPYKFRTSGGSKDIGNREYDEIVGGSIVWNQLQKAILSRTNGGITFTYTDGSLKVSGTASSNAYWLYNSDTFKENYVKNHVYLVDTGNDTAGSTTTFFWYVPSVGNGAMTTTRGMFKASQTALDYFQLCVLNGQTIDLTFKPQVFDLTAMFGSTVADYIYSLETAQSGKGVAFFKSLFPNDYYPYNAGELLSVEGLQSHDTVGFNQWDEEWQLGYINPSTGDYSPRSDRICSKNYIPVLPDTAYYFEDPSPTYMTAVWYDENKARIRNNSPHNEVITSPSNARYLRFSMPSEYGTTYKNDICINLSWSGWRNGEYEPYKKHSYPLDSSLTLRGIPKLNAQNELYFDGDIYSYDGKVKRRYTYFKATTVYGVATIGDYTRFALNGVTETATSPTAGKQMCSYGIPLLWEYGTESENFYIDGTSIIVVLKSSTVGTTKASIESYIATHPLEFVYELATPTEETAEPYTSPQAVDDFGTEEYISGNLVPVGHNTKYPANLRDKLQHLPNMADSDGYYMISQQNKQMSLELFRIPKAPTTDGTYILKATVSGGTPTYTWESEEAE